MGQTHILNELSLIERIAYLSSVLEEPLKKPQAHTPTPLKSLAHLAINLDYDPVHSLEKQEPEHCNYIPLLNPKPL